VDGSACLCLFIKSPESRRIKTRLAADVGTDKARAIYTAMVLDLLTNIRECAIPLHYYLNSPEGISSFFEPAGIDQSAIYLQRGKTIGERMSNCFREEFARGYEKVVLIGSDIPAIDASLIQTSFQHLEHHETVIGPAADGGYYLIGFHKDTFHPGCFSDIPWSTSRVYRETIDRFKKQNLSWYAGPVLQDIDDLGGLQNVVYNASLVYRLPHLMAATSDLKSDASGQS